MPYQKRLKKTYGAIESRAQSGSDYKFGGGGLDSTGDTTFTNNNNNVSNFDENIRKYRLCMKRYTTFTSQKAITSYIL